MSNPLDYLPTIAAAKHDPRIPEEEANSFHASGILLMAGALAVN